jgi:hypothetical protein
MDRERIDQFLEAGILGLTLGILIYAPIAIGAVLPLDFLLLEVMLLGILLLWVIRIFVIREVKLLWTPVCWGILAFVVYASARYLSANVEYVARTELLQIIFYTAFFFAILNNLHRRRAVSIIAGTLLTLGTLISIYAIYQYLTRSEWVLVYPKPLQYVGRASGTYICPNHFAGLLVMLLPLGISLLLSARVSYLVRILLGYSVLMMTCGLCNNCFASRLAFSRCWYVICSNCAFTQTAVLVTGCYCNDTFGICGFLPIQQ